MPTKIPKFGGGGDVTKRDTIQFTSDYADFLPGVNYETFYYGTVNSTVSPILFPTTFSTSALGASTEADITGAAFTKIFDQDFDYEINGERLIGGDCLISVKWKNWEGAGDATETYIIAKIIHYDGTTETTIGNVTGFTGTGTDQTFTLTLFVNLTKKHFKIGDVLRLTLEGWGKSDDAADADNKIEVFHDGVLTWAKIPFIRLDEY